MSQTIVGDVHTGAPGDTAPDTGESGYRAGAYSYLAALLRAEPGSEVLNAVAQLSGEDQSKDDLTAAISMLGLAARTCEPADVREEYFNLFIGLGRGELVPYGSWYQTGFLMEKPLGVLRDDLRTLGFERDEATSEPEDHVAALFEVMAMLIGDSTPPDQQKVFFEKHLSGWVMRFFDDLASAQAATFYRSVARFGKAFMEFERKYLGMPV